jgi:type IV pilus assembly protein PilF
MTQCWRSMFLAALAVMLLAAAGCSTTVTTASGPISDPTPTPKVPGDGDAGRRANVRLELAGAYFSRGQMTVALQEVERAIVADPNLGAAYNLRGLILANQGDEKLAEESFRKALALNPRDLDALQNYGWFLCQHRRYGEADQQFVLALAVPQNREVSRTLLAQGVCYTRSGALEDAERALLRAYETDPNNPTLQYTIAEVLLRRNEPERARFYARRINAVPALISAQTLWLAARIEHKLGNTTGVQDLGAQLRTRFRESREAVAFERGQFNE